MSLPGDPRSRQNVPSDAFAGQRRTTSTKYTAYTGTCMTKVLQGQALSSCTLCLACEHLECRVDSSEGTLASEKRQHVEDPRTHAGAGECHAQGLKKPTGTETATFRYAA